MSPHDALKEGTPAAVKAADGVPLPGEALREPAPRARNARNGNAAKAQAQAEPPDALRSGPAPEPLTTVHGEPSYSLGNRDVELFVTRRGGHLGPVRFRLGRRWVQPYALAPWLPDGIAATFPPVLKVLRGDYFCFPFGGGKGIADIHGETANAAWTLAQEGSGRMALDMQLSAPRCQIQKVVSIKEGHRAVYQEHRIEGLQGRYNFGHHAVLEFPAEGGPFHVNVSPFRFGSVKPEPFTDPLQREYGALKTGARFRSLEKVPLATGGAADLTRYPARQGFEDLIMVASRPGDFAWTAATLDGYIWVSLKDPRILPSTLFWISNGGRHADPWNGRHLRRLGLEEVCGHFCDGLEESRKDRLRDQGVPTTGYFRAKEAKSVRVIHLVHPVPAGFGRVEAVEKGGDGTEITVHGALGKVRVPVDWSFLHG